MKTTDKRYVPGTGLFYVFHHDHKRAKDRCVVKFTCPYEAKRVACQLNGYLAKSDPVEGRPGKFSFYYVHVIRNSGTLPWIKRTIGMFDVTNDAMDRGEGKQRGRRARIQKGVECGS